MHHTSQQKHEKNGAHALLVWRNISGCSSTGIHSIDAQLIVGLYRLKLSKPAGSTTKQILKAF
jgi:hypothetical protein